MAEAYAENGFYVYPTETPETAPINLMKAQANGCIPITSRYPASAIPETTGTQIEQIDTHTTHTP